MNLLVARNLGDGVDVPRLREAKSKRLELTSERRTEGAYFRPTTLALLPIFPLAWMATSAVPASIASLTSGTLSLYLLAYLLDFL